METEAEIIEQANNTTHEFLQEFLDETNDNDPLGIHLKATICQIIFGVKKKIFEIADKKDGWISHEDLIGVQIKELHRAISSLHSSLTALTTPKTIQ